MIYGLKCPYWREGTCTKGHYTDLRPVKVCSMDCPEPDIQLERARLAQAQGVPLVPPGACPPCAE